MKNCDKIDKNDFYKQGSFYERIHNFTVADLLYAVLHPGLVLRVFLLLSEIRSFTE